MVLAELGEVSEAEAIMRDSPPDEVAIIPGLRPWARSAVEAATGHHRRATRSAIEAAQTAARQGAAAMAMNFLTDAARYGDAREAAAALPGLGAAPGHAGAAGPGGRHQRPGRHVTPRS